MSLLPSDNLLTTREALSGAFGSISIACWIFVLVPQFLENYRNQSAEAVSLAFIVIWLVGDVTNLLGGLWADLVPTAIALAVWFCFTDAALVVQAMYYNIRNRRREGQAWLKALRQSVSGDLAGNEAAEAVARVRRMEEQQQQEPEEQETEEQPLLKRTASNNVNNGGSSSGGHASGNTNGISPVQRRSTIDTEMRRQRTMSNNSHVLTKVFEERDTASGTRLWLKNIFSVIAIWLIGAVGWYVSYKTGAWKPSPVSPSPGMPSDGGPSDRQAKGGQVLGYISCVAYLGARIPQIVKNWREQSCEGLSLLFFVLSLCGNLTYGISFFAHSTERSYIIPKLPWLIGSMGTIVEDMFIFVQFHLYRNDEDDDDDDPYAFHEAGVAVVD